MKTKQKFITSTGKCDNPSHKFLGAGFLDCTHPTVVPEM